MTLSEPPARIFMAEDNPGDVTLMREAISAVGLSVDLEVATDGALAISALIDPGHLPPDLIILNFNLPKWQGHEVLSVIKRSDRLLGVPVVMLTTSDAQADRLLCATADAYFIKSGNWDELLRIVRHLQKLIVSHPSERPMSAQHLKNDTFWKQGIAGPQGTGTKPIADLHLTKGSARHRVGQPLDQTDAP